MKIKTRDVKFSIGDMDILNGINIDIDQKKFIGIIGPNGSGKSTFLKCLYRIQKPSSGVIKFNDINIDKIAIKQSAKEVSVVSQHNYYDFDFTVKDIVIMGRSPHKKLLERDNIEDFKLVDEALEKVNMIELKDRSFNTLSGGEQQRVILARALVQRPNCLILDEPTNHLDIKYQLQLMNIVKNLDIEVVAAIHDLNIAAMYCDEIYVLNNGKIVAHGSPKDVLTKELIKKVYEVDVHLYTYNDNLSIIFNNI